MRKQRLFVHPPELDCRCVPCDRVWGRPGVACRTWSRLERIAATHPLAGHIVWLDLTLADCRERIKDLVCILHRKGVGHRVHWTRHTVIVANRFSVRFASMRQSGALEGREWDRFWFAPGTYLRTLRQPWQWTGHRAWALSVAAQFGIEIGK